MPYYHILFETPESKYNHDWFGLCDRQADTILEHFLDFDIDVFAREWGDRDSMKITTWSVEFSVNKDKMDSFLEKTKSNVVQKLLKEYNCVIQKMETSDEMDDEDNE